MKIALTPDERGTPASVNGLPWGRWVLIGIVCTYVAVLLGAPLVALVVGAFAGGLHAVGRALTDPLLGAALSLTLQISLVTVVVNGVGGIVVAWVLVRQRFPGRRALYGLINLPFAVSPVVVGYMLIVLFGRLGPLAGIEDALGVQVAFAVPGMILATTFVTLPLMIRELIPVIERLDREQERAAATLGAPRWQVVLRITFPAIRWAIVYGAILTFARALGEFGAVLVVGGDIQGATETLPLYIFRALDARDDIPAYAVALLLAFVSFVLVVGVERLRSGRHARI